MHGRAAASLAVEEFDLGELAIVFRDGDAVRGACCRTVQFISCRALSDYLRQTAGDVGARRIRDGGFAGRRCAAGTGQDDLRERLAADGGQFDVGAGLADVEGFVFGTGVVVVVEPVELAVGAGLDMIGVAVDGIGALRCGRGVVLVVVGECGCRHVLSAREIEHDVRRIRGFGIRAALGEGGCIGHVARTKLYGAFIEGDITGQIARFRSRVLLACESGGVLCHVDGQIGRTDLERGGTHSPITGRCGRSDVLDRDEHTLIIDQIVIQLL